MALVGLLDIPIAEFAKRADLKDRVTPDQRLSLDDIKLSLGQIKMWTDTLKVWTSLATPLPGCNHLADWVRDYANTAYEPEHKGSFVLFVRHVLAAAYRCAPTDTITRLTDKYLDLASRINLKTWDSPIELLVCTLLFNERWQADFLDLARELVQDTDTNELIAICCWAIRARQTKYNQQDYTRSAVTNIVALILTLERGPTFKYNSFNYDFIFTDKTGAKLEVWMPDFARFWFNVEMPNFCARPSRIDAFHALLV